MSLVEVKVPDIGDFTDVPVIELFVKVGDSIKAEDAIATLESDKATMDVPSSATGVIHGVPDRRVVAHHDARCAKEQHLLVCRVPDRH